MNLTLTLLDPDELLLFAAFTTNLAELRRKRSALDQVGAALGEPADARTRQALKQARSEFNRAYANELAAAGRQIPDFNESGVVHLDPARPGRP